MTVLSLLVQLTELASLQDMFGCFELAGVRQPRPCGDTYPDNDGARNQRHQNNLQVGAPTGRIDPNNS